MKTFHPIWYTIPIFAGVIPQNPRSREQDPIEMKTDAPRNLHVLARAEFEMAERDAGPFLLDITADDCYKLYVNGTFAGQGPAPACPEHYYYNTIDIAPFLRDGKNILAVHLYYQGLVNRVWNSGDGRFALAAELRQASRPLAWRYRISRAYSGEATGYDTQFLENFDSRQWETDWKEPEYDDRSWDRMVPALWADYRLVPQTVKMLSVYEMKPRRIIRAGRGHWLVDAGEEITGGLLVTAEGTPGSKVAILCGEELLQETGRISEEDPEAQGSRNLPEGELVRSRLRCGCTYREEWILGEGASEYIPYDYKGFRYAELRTEDDVRIQSVRLLIRHYPLDESRCTLRTGAPYVEEIFRICRQAVKLCTQGGYLDCPTREKGQYLGDAVITSRSQVWLSGTTEMLRKCSGNASGNLR